MHNDQFTSHRANPTDSDSKTSGGFQRQDRILDARITLALHRVSSQAYFLGFADMVSATSISEVAKRRVCTGSLVVGPEFGSGNVASIKVRSACPFYPPPFVSLLLTANRSTQNTTSTYLTNLIYTTSILLARCSKPGVETCHRKYCLKMFKQGLRDIVLGPRKSLRC